MAEILDSGTRRVWNGQLNKRGDKRGCIATHGQSKTRLYGIWCGIKKRCYDPRNKRYANYGGRGIKVCEEWQTFEPFYEWAMANSYVENLTIDRIDTNGNYEPSNCRWADAITQQNNTTRNHMLTAFGETKTIAEWSRSSGIRADVIKDRLNKLHWSVEDAVSIPTLPIGGKRK